MIRSESMIKCQLNDQCKGIFSLQNKREKQPFQLIIGLFQLLFKNCEELVIKRLEEVTGVWSEKLKLNPVFC